MSFIRSCAFLVVAIALAACGARKEAETPKAEPARPSAEALLAAAIASPRRTEEEKARDVWRHPQETLTFFGVAPSMAVVEISPGGGWYTNILAPYLQSGGGVYYAALFDPESSDRARAAYERFKTTYADASIYGDVRITTLGGEVAPAGAADVVLTFRNVHNWISNETAAANFSAFYAALKPGGVLGVVEHRLNEDMDEKNGETGYVKTSTVTALAEAAGFKLAGASEINANPKDTKDHPFGVWTLPPVRRSSEIAGQEDPAFDRAKYDAIGESDRMTLKFVKPAE